MANREKGEVSVEAGGNTYTLILTTNAMVELEDLFSTPEKELKFQEILERTAQGSIKYLRGFIWATLREHHPEMTVKDAGQLIQDAGGLLGFANQIETLAASAQPDKRDLADLGVSPNPRKAQTRRRGTGGRSTSPHAAPV